MSEYLVIWHYVANHGTITVSVRGFSPDFGLRAVLYAALKSTITTSTPGDALRPLSPARP